MKSTNEGVRNSLDGKLFKIAVLLFTVAAMVVVLSARSDASRADKQGRSRIKLDKPVTEADRQTDANAARMLSEGKNTFRFDTFGDELFWTNTLQLNRAIAGANLGGVGPGVSPNTALGVGLKVDVDALPQSLISQLRLGRVNLDDPATALALLKLNAVLGVKGTVGDDGSLQSVGITCALCHSTVDDSFAPGIGHRLDGWANRDLNVGAIIALSPNLQPFVDLLGVNDAAVRTVLQSWGPGKFDAELILDGKAFRPDGKSAATLIPPAFGLAGVNLHTWTGWGSVTHWNAFVANLEMHGQGTFYDPRLNDAAKFPIAAREGFGNVRNDPDLITAKLPALHFYQLAIPAPPAPPGSFDAAAAARGETVFKGAADARSATCRRSSPSRDGTCTRPQRSASTTSRRSVRLTNVTEPRRSKDFGRTRKAAFTTMGASRLCGM